MNQQASVRSIEGPRYAPTWMGLAYAFFIMISTLYPYTRSFSVPWFTIWAAYAGIIGMGFLWMFTTGCFERLKVTNHFFWMYTLTYLLLLCVSLFLWIRAQESLSYIKRGVGVILYQLIINLMVCTAAYLFGRRAIHYTLLGMAAGYGVIIATVIQQFGLGTFVSSMVEFYAGLGKTDNAVVQALEVHDLTFAFGELCIYYLIFEKERRRKIIGFGVAFVCFILGWKRIALAGIALAFGYVTLMRRLRPRTVVRLTAAIFFLVFLANYGYLYLIKSGLYAKIMEAEGVDTMGRVQLYRYFGSYYEINPLFTGYGMGYISRQMQNLLDQGFGVLNNALSVHNDILKRYIELGFWGFTAWNFYTFSGVFQWVRSKYDFDTVTLYVSLTIFVYCTYLTDNTVEYYHINTCLRLLPMALAVESSKPLWRRKGGLA
ncbi:MAG: O-antigen ligase family protein [Eubacteriales bacterium]|nr:O-antigen ligase family protein [Eubacteriales bacterium]